MNLKPKKKITFFTPTMQRTGSEIVLFNLLNHMDPDFSVTVFSKYKGPLLQQLKQTIRTHFLYKGVPKNLMQRVANKLTKEWIVPLQLATCKHSVWYCNTIMLSEILLYAKKAQVSCILHVHELEQMFVGMRQEQINLLVQFPKLIIANSEASRKVLQELGREKNVKLCYPAVDTDAIYKDPVVYEDFRKKLGIAKDTFVWIMCGTLDENKNPFLFLEVAGEVIKFCSNSRFIWNGSSTNEAYTVQCRKKAAELGVSEYVIWLTEPTSDYLSYFRCADGFFLTSKKESFSLATLEALLLELPVVANNCEGVKEILRNDVGKVIAEANNAKEMAMAMISYIQGVSEKERIRGKERAKDFDIKIGSKKWNQILNEYFSEEL